ncbi:MAG: hypothetical protein IPO30_18645 [Hyphomonadaceae bacterium]|nr:hypothetical protein [Hyphomonadaceae bacterium]
MKSFPMTLAALGAFCALAACESAGGQYDGVSRFAGAYGPYYGPGSPPREAPPEDVAGPAETQGNI